jgi:putative ABC transport system ATP-binding protein
MAEGLIEIFSDLPPGSPLFERFSFIDAEELPEFERIVEQARQGGVPQLPSAAQARLVALGLSYNEQRHRMNVLEPGFEDRVVRARQSLRTYLPQGYAGDITFYDPEEALAGASLRDNMLFGRIAYGVSNAEARVTAILAGVLAAQGLTDTVNRMGLDAEAGSGGRQLQPRQRSAVALARAMIGRPAVLILDNAFAGYSASDVQAALRQIRAELTGRTLLVTLNDSAEAEGLDRILTFDGPKLSQDSRTGAADEAAPANAAMA